MKRILIIAFSLVVLMSMSSLATNTRVKTMGDNNTILLDDANIWQFPSRINDYPNVAIAEIGRASSQLYDSSSNFYRFGIHWKFNEDNPWVLGTYLYNSEVVSPRSSPFYDDSEFVYSPYDYGYDSAFVPFDTLLQSNQRIDLFCGRLLGPNQIPFGFHFGAIHSSQKYDVPIDKSEEGFRIYDFSAGLTFQANTDLAAGLKLMTWTDKATNSTTWDQSKPKGNYLFYLRGRHFWQPGPPPWTIIPHAAIYTGKNEAEYYEIVPPDTVSSLAQTDKYSFFSFNLGSGLQYTPSNDATAVLDFGIMYRKLKGEFTPTGGQIREASEKTLTIPYFKAGTDLKVFNWMDLRLGATSYWNRRTLENDDPTVPDKLIQNYPKNKTYLGFGFHWGNLHVDTYTDPQLFLNGFNFISGQTSSMNAQISALYEIM
jgi:opacity protein-like surface antigen